VNFRIAGIIFAAALAASSASAQYSARYLVFNVSRTGEVTLYGETSVTLDALPVSEEIPDGGIPGATMGGIDENLPHGIERVVVDVLDPAGRAVFRQHADVQRFVHAEWPDALTGEMQGRWIEQEPAAFVVRIPEDSGQSLFVTHRPTGQFSRVDLGKLSPEQMTRTTPAPPPANSANRLDVLIMGDGYTASQTTKFQTDADNLVASFFGLSPYSDYKNYVNTTSLFTASTQSGADHPFCSGDPGHNPDPLEGTFVSTAFDATFCSGGIQRLLTVNGSKVLTAAAASPNFDEIFVLVNDTFYGGAGGGISVGSLNSSSTNVMQHEFGHSFTGLADEYTAAYPGFPACSDVTSPPCEANVTDQTSRALIKWTSWIAAATPLPTPESDTTDIGLFTGARYHSTGYYRPKHNCVMNSLGVPFCEICKQAFILKMYRGWTTSGGTTGSPANGVDMIEPGSESPATTGTVAASVGASTSFSFTLLQPVGGPSGTVQWSVDNAPVQGANGVTFQYTPSTTGNHTVSLTVTDATTSVKAAMAGTSLIHTRSWNVAVSLPAPSNMLATATTSQVAVTWNPVSGATSYEVAKKTNGGSYITVTTVATTSFTDSAVTLNNAYVYKVRALGGGPTGAYSTPDLATVFLATDDPLQTTTLIKAAHLTEIRAAVNLACTAAGLPAASYSRSIAAGLAPKTTDVQEVRTAINAARGALGMPAFSFTDSTLTVGTTPIKRSHAQELRSAIR
jgi:hypothetical protein